VFKLMIFGGGGNLGRLVVAEATARGLQVSAAVRDPDRHRDLASDDVTVVGADATDAESVARAVVGHDAVIASLYQDQIPHDVFYRQAATALLTGLADARVGRLVVVGAAASLESAPGVRIMDGPDFPAEYLPSAQGHTAALETLRAAPASGVDWLTLTPPPVLSQVGARTGRYRLGADAVLLGGDGPAGLSYADLAIALVDEALAPTRHRSRAAVAW
jgi:uncharacterized protein